MRTSIAVTFAALALVAGCATKPADPEPATIDVAAMPDDQRKALGDWIDYICSLPPEKRVGAMKDAPKEYVLLGSGQENAAVHGPTLGFTCATH